MFKKNYAWIIFFVYLLINVIIAILQKGPSTYPDELCYISQAQHFLKEFEFIRCREILDIPITESAPLHPILLSPIYSFFNSKIAYKLALLLNALLISSLVFPLKKIFSRFLDNKKHIFWAIILTILIPQINAFTHTLMSETFFVIANIYFISYYIQSFQKKYLNKYKILSFSIALISIFLRPFGFLVMLSMLINELLTYKFKNKKKYLYFIPLLLLAVIPIFILKPDLLSRLFKILLSIISIHDYFLYFIKSIKDQINSFNIATFLVPTGLFFIVLFQTNKQKYKKIRAFLISFVILNFIISAQHIFGYYLELQPANLITRYVNISLIFIFIFTFIFLFNKDYIKNRISTYLIFLPLILSFYYYGLIWKEVSTPMFDLFKIVTIRNIAMHLFVPTILILLFLAIFKRYKTILVIIAILMLTFTINQKVYTTSTSRLFLSENDVTNFFSNKTTNILYISNTPSNYLSYRINRLEAITENNVDRIKVYKNQIKDFDSKQEPIKDFFYHKSLLEIIESKPEELKSIFKDYDYIITNICLDLPKIQKTQRAGNIYKVPSNDQE